MLHRRGMTELAEEGQEHLEEEEGRKKGSLSLND
jgi:hypothetical protein